MTRLAAQSVHDLQWTARLLGLPLARACVFAVDESDRVVLQLTSSGLSDPCWLHLCLGDLVERLVLLIHVGLVYLDALSESSTADFVNDEALIDVALLRLQQRVVGDASRLESFEHWVHHADTADAIFAVLRWRRFSLIFQVYALLHLRELDKSEAALDARHHLRAGLLVLNALTPV